MASEHIYGGAATSGSALTDEERAALSRIMSLAFASSPEDVGKWLERVGTENLRTLRRREGAVPEATLVRIPMAQFWGGRSVPMLGIAGVGVAPEARGRGLASQLMREAILECRRDGVPLSGLYPATQPLYRRVGYEQSGHRFEITVPMTRLGLAEAVPPDLPPIRAMTEADHDAVRACYSRYAAGFDGHLDRSPYIWNRVFAPRGERTAGFVVVPEGGAGLEGYVVTQQTRGPAPEMRHNVTLTDVGATTTRAAQRILRFLAEFDSLGVDVIWHGGPTHPLLLLLGEQRYRLSFRDHWMLRLVDVPGALEQRGYGTGVAGEIHLEVHDEVIDANDGRFVLRVRDGRAEVKPGGRGTLVLDVGALATLYSGFTTPWALRLAGRLSGTDEDLAAAAGVFAGPTPWMPDMF